MIATGSQIEATVSDVGWYLAELAELELRGEYEAYGAMAATACRLYPGNHDLLFARAVHHLRRGQWAEGWADYEHRPSRLQLAAKLDEFEFWDGKQLNPGKSLLIAPEQGSGDALMFARWIPSAIDAAGRVVLYTKPELARLFSNLGCTVVSDGRDVDGESIGAWIGISSLPHVLGGLPNPPLFNVPPAPLHLPQTGRLRVGLCWAGSAEHKRDEHRSLPFSAFDDLLKLDCDFYALQFGPQSADNDGRATDLTPYLHDFAATAGVLKQLDLLISVDTGIVHLAGALGVKTLMIVKKWRDWRWGLTGWRIQGWYNSVSISDLAYALVDLRGLVADRKIAQHKLHVAVDDPKRAPEFPTEAISETRYGKFTVDPRDRYIGRSLREYGEWSHQETELMRHFVKPGDTVTDVGANLGYFTVALSQFVGPKGRVWAFEPIPATFDLLTRNVRASNVTAFRGALGSERGQASASPIADNPGGTEVVPCEDGAIEVRTLDSFNLARLDFMKVDVEGSELAVLKGAENTIERLRPLLLVENDRFHKTEALILWLHQKRYRMYQFLPRLYNSDNLKSLRLNVFGNLVSSMILAVPQEKRLEWPDSLGLARIRIELRAA